MDTFQDELNDMLVSRMDPTQVCTVSGLCWKPDNSDIEQRASEIFLRKSSEKTCDACKSNVSKMVGIIQFVEKVRGQAIGHYSRETSAHRMSIGKELSIRNLNQVRGCSRITWESTYVKMNLKVQKKHRDMSLAFRESSLRRSAKRARTMDSPCTK